MLSETLQAGLTEYSIGAKVRSLRLKKKLGLVEFGQHTGLSPALLSKIERGRLFPTLPTLLRIALVFSVGLEFFFTGPRDGPLVAVVRKDKRVQLPDRPGARDVAYRFESLEPVRHIACARTIRQLHAFVLPHHGDERPVARAGKEELETDAEDERDAQQRRQGRKEASPLDLR